MSHLGDIDTVIDEKMLRFKLPAAHSVRVPADDAQGLARSVFLGRAAIFGHKEIDVCSGQPECGKPLREGRRWM